MKGTEKERERAKARQHHSSQSPLRFMLASTIFVSYPERNKAATVERYAQLLIRK